MLPPDDSPVQANAAPAKDRVVIARVLEALRQSEKTDVELAKAAGCSQPYISQLRKGKRENPGGVLVPLCAALGLDPLTGLPRSEEPPALAADKYDWLRRIDLRQLGVIPPAKRPPENFTGAVFVDTAQQPYTMTETQVQVVIAMIERRYAEAITLIAEVMQGKREH